MHRQYTNRPYTEEKCLTVCSLFQNKRLEGEVEKNEQQIEKFKSNMKKIETENNVLYFGHNFCQSFIMS